MADIAERRGRVVLATVGLAVPAVDAVLLAGAVADTAEQHGWRDVRVEGGEVSGLRDDTQPRRWPEPCPGCGRRVGRYPGGRPYRHRCKAADTS
jgi:hypothetical protein